MFQRSPRHTLIALLACICVGPQGAAAHASPPVSLTQLEDRARAFAPSARLAQADVTVAEQRSAALQAGSGAQLFGGAGVDNAREAVTDTLSRDYQRTQMHLGVRWPLLGALYQYVSPANASDTGVRLGAPITAHASRVLDAAGRVITSVGHFGSWARPARI